MLANNEAIKKIKKKQRFRPTAGLLISKPSKTLNM
jgi:hypothetical protein